MKLLLGAGIDFSGVKLPFSVGDLLSSSTSLLSLIGAFVALSITVVFVPKLVNVIWEAVQPGSTAQRDEFGNRIHFQSKEAKAYKERFYKEKGWS